MELRKMLKPQRLGNLSLPDMELTEDKKTCRKFGPCGVGKKAIYLHRKKILCSDEVGEAYFQKNCDE